MNIIIGMFKYQVIKNEGNKKKRHGYENPGMGEQKIFVENNIFIL